MDRYAVQTPDGWLGGNRGSDWSTGSPRACYHLVRQEIARLWLRKADATKAANAMGGGRVVPVSLSFKE